MFSALSRAFSVWGSEACSSSFRVSPELAFHNHQIAAVGHVKVIEEPGRGRKFEAHRDESTEARFNLVYRQHLRETKD